MFRQPAGQGIGHNLEFSLCAELLAHQAHLAGIIGRIGLWIAGRRGHDVRRRESISHRVHGMIPLRPVNQIVGQVDDALGRTARIGQLTPRDVRFFQEVTQELGAGCGEGLVDGLVGVADAHPVAVGSDQQPQDFLLQPAAILRLVLQYEGPAIAQPLQVLRVQLQGLQRQADEVIEIHSATIDQGALIVGVDGPTHLRQGKRLRQSVQHRAQLGRSDLRILGLPDEAEGNGAHQARPLIAAHPIPFPLFQIKGQEIVGTVGVAAQPG